MEIKSSVHAGPSALIGEARGSRVKILVILVSLVACVATYQAAKLYFSSSFMDDLASHFTSKGYRNLRHDTSLWDALSKAPWRFMSSRRLSVEPVPELFFDIKFKHMGKLQKKRNEAIARGLLIQGPDDFVPASIRYAGRTIKIKLRLKGDRLDHLLGDKWSFRVQVKGKDQLFGMRRFSIQDPKVRGYQGEVLINAAMRHVGVLTPRYSFANVVLNGERVGLMAVEEHFSKEMLEANGRRDGVIVRFDESMFWASWDKNIPVPVRVYNDFRNARVQAFRSARISKSPRLSQDYATAVGLLRAFAGRKIAASEIFDVELMGRYLAVSKLWGAWHGVRWHNQRFYLNPVSVKLEPISFDGNLQLRLGVGQTRPEPIVAAMLEDPKIFSAYRRTLRELGNEIESGGLIKTLQKIEDKNLRTLRKEFYYLESFPYEELSERISRLRTADLTATAQDGTSYPTLLWAYVVKEGGQHFLEIVNAVSRVVEVHSVNWVARQAEAAAKFTPLSNNPFPLRLKARTLGESPLTVRIPFTVPPGGEKQSLTVSASIEGESVRQVSKATAYYPRLTRHPIPTSTVAEQLSRHAFLTLDKAQNQLTVRAGIWPVRGALIVPKGISLVLSAGTTLRFEPRGALIAHGPLHLRGTKEAPVTLEGLPDGASTGNEGPWQGAAVLNAGSQSQWTHVVVRNTSGIDRPGWQLTGGLTFYRSNIRIDDARLQGHRGEDALNVISSQFAFKNLQISDTASDGFDADFSDGTITGGLFTRIGKAGGGDAIDISGSEVTVDGARFVHIGDKALSVGERSTMTARGLTIEQAGTGAAAKDGSRLRIDDMSITNSRHAGLMAYVKKNEFGAASIEALNLRFSGPAPNARVQKGSQITIDGTAIDEEDVDVEQLYKTVMRPGLRR